MVWEFSGLGVEGVLGCRDVGPRYLFTLNAKP